MSEQYIARVPERIWGEGRPPNARQWSSEFNMASWIRLTRGAGPVELRVYHRDEGGDHVTPVDTVDASGHESALLSGVVQLRFEGRVDEVRVGVRLGSDGMRYEVDELFMQRRDSALSQDNKLISNF